MPEESTPPPIAVLCGSTRHRRDFEETNRALTLEGFIVLAPGVFAHADGVTLDDTVKARLDELHLRKIDLADVMFVVNPDGRIGDSTRAEIAYAHAHGKPVRYLTPPSTSAEGS